jgi:phosphate starvation-inducible PhoH-like protein
MSKSYKELMNQITTFVFDVDGVLTDGTIHVTPTGEMLRNMNIRDGYAMKAAVDLLADPNSPYEKIIIVRPAVEAEEKLGALPGNVEEKLDPYIFPSYYLLNKIIGKDNRESLKNIEAIEVFALAYMRGMNIDNSILIFEEAQNCTPKQMKLLLTRIGFKSKFFISGDLEQTDRYKDKTQSGLWDAIEKFKNVNDIGVFEFNDKDIVRNPLISQILSKYEE